MSENYQENTCAGVSFLKKLLAGGWRLATLQVTGSCEFFELFQNTHFVKHLWTAAYVNACCYIKNTITLFIVINGSSGIKKCDNSAIQKDQDRQIKKENRENEKLMLKTLFGMRLIFS